MYDRQTISAITRELDRREKAEEQDLILSRQDQACPVSAQRLDLDLDCDPEGDPDEQAIARALQMMT